MNWVQNVKTAAPNFKTVVKNFKTQVKNFKTLYSGYSRCLRCRIIVEKNLIASMGFRTGFFLGRFARDGKGSEPPVPWVFELFLLSFFAKNAWVFEILWKNAWVLVRIKSFCQILTEFRNFRAKIAFFFKKKVLLSNF